jgi:GH25 family lysozyme M1 (1,4-beta-N-acetylmuramidase)
MGESDQYAGSATLFSASNMTLLDSTIKKYPIVGIDVSKHQGEWDARTAVAQGASFVIIRAGYATLDGGVPTADSNFVKNWRDADVANLPRGAYWYFVTGSDPIEQAKFFVNTVRMAAGTPSELGLFGDFENNKAKLPMYKVQQSVKLFLDTVDRLWGQGQKCGLYSGAGWWNPNMGSMPGLVAGRIRWVANYNVPMPIVPNGWGGWDIWQCSADGNNLGPKFGCYSRSVDVNVMSWTAARFEQEFGVKPNTIAQINSGMQPAGKPDWVMMRSTAAIRDAAGLTGKLKGQANFGSIWKVEEEKSGWYKIAADAWVSSSVCQAVVR